MARKMEALAAAAANPKPAMRQIAQEMKAEAQARFDAQDFPPLAESTVKKRAQGAMRAVQKKHEDEVAKAIEKARPPRGLLARVLGIGKSAGLAAALSSKSVQRRQAALEEHRRLRGRVSRMVGLKPLSVQQLQRVAARADKAVAKAVGGKILGRMRGLLRTSATSVNARLRLQTARDWSESQNSGGTVGHGAQLPARKTVELTDKLRQRAEEILEAFLVDKIRE